MMAAIADKQRPLLIDETNTAWTKESISGGDDRPYDSVCTNFPTKDEVRTIRRQEPVRHVVVPHDGPAPTQADGGKRSGHGYTDILTSTFVPTTLTAWGCSWTSGAVKHSPLARSYWN